MLFQRIYSHAKTAESGTGVRGTFKLISCTTVPAGRSRRPQHPLRWTSPKTPTPMRGCAPSLIAKRVALVLVPWRFTWGHTVVSWFSPPFNCHNLPLFSPHSVFLKWLEIILSHINIRPLVQFVWLCACVCTPGERPFVCLICLSAFTTKANCERHLKVHTDTLNGVCHGCGFISTTRDILYSHLVTSHMVCQPGSRSEVCSPKLPLASGKLSYWISPVPGVALLCTFSCFVCSNTPNWEKVL